MRTIVVLVATLVALSSIGFGTTAFATNTAPAAFSTENVDDAASPSSNRAPTTISNCTEITESGYYELSQDLTQREDRQACIEVRADDVVFDGNGHTITMDQSSANGAPGIDVQKVSNVTIRDVTLRSGENSSYYDGIKVAWADSVTIQDVTVVNFHSGIAVRESDDGRIENVTVSENSRGIELLDSNGYTVVDNTVVDNRRTIAGGIGISISGDPDPSVGRDHVIANNTVRNNVKGVRVSLSTNVTVEANTLADNTVSRTPKTSPGDDVNVRVVHSSDVTVADNVVRVGGIHIEGHGDGGDNVVRNNTLEQGFITLRETEGARIVNNSIYNASNVTRPRPLSSISYGAAIAVLERSNNTTIVGNEIVDPSRLLDGIVVWRDAQGVVIERNDIEDARNGVNIAHTARSITIEQNDIVANREAGVNAAWGIRSLSIERNVIRDNKDGVFLDNNVTAQVHQNVIANNSRFGIDTDGDEVVNATNNYWGSSDGPSSRVGHDECPINGSLVDPVTGEPADGDGDAVSQNPDDRGVSNVHFDPWLSTPPEDAGNPDSDD